MGGVGTVNLSENMRGIGGKIASDRDELHGKEGLRACTSQIMSTLIAATDTDLGNA
jgi:hypothetical protein